MFLFIFRIQENVRLKENVEALKRHSAQSMDATVSLTKVIGKLVLKY
jgi:hypothetical protein